MTQESTAGHGPSKGFHSMNDHLKRYFRGKGNSHQKRMDEAFTRVGRLGKLPHSLALKMDGGIAIKKVREEFARGVTKAELRKNYGISISRLNGILYGIVPKSVK